MSKGNNKENNNNYQQGYTTTKNVKGFSAALLLGLSPVQSSMFEMSDGGGNGSGGNDVQRLNTSVSAVQGDMSSGMMNDFITMDLMQKIEQLSPISPNQQIKTRMSDVIMINCEDNNNSSSSSRSSANSGLYSDTSEELELKEDENTKKRNKKGVNNINNDNNGCKACINVNNSSQQQQQNMMMITHNKMKNFEKKFNKSFCAGDKGSNSNNNNEHGLLFNQHSHSIGGFSSNNNNNKSQVYSYYDSTSRYLSQVLQGEDTEKNESKACDSLNNSNNYIPKNFLGLGNNANLSGSNSTTSYNIEPFNKSDKDRNSNSIFDNINANNIHEFTAGQYSTQFQHQLNNQFDLLMNNNNNTNNTNNNNNVSNSNSNNKDNNNSVNKVILQNIMHQQRTPVTAISNTNGNNNNNNNENVVDNNNVFTNPFIFESRPPPIQTLPPPLPPFPNTNPFANPLALSTGNNLMNYFAQIQIIQQKNYIDYTNALNNNNNNNNNPPTSTNPFPRRDKVTSSSSLNNIDSTNDNNNTNHKEVNTKQQQHMPTTKKSKQKDEPKEYLLEMFGRIGWICNKCNNFNYETRNRCNRCSANKDPRKLSDIHKKNKDKDESNQSKKKNKEQKADWVCPNCSNLNFGFRKICNRCQIPKAQTQ